MAPPPPLHPQPLAGPPCSAPCCDHCRDHHHHPVHRAAPVPLPLQSPWFCVVGCGAPPFSGLQLPTQDGPGRVTALTHVFDDEGKILSVTESPASAGRPRGWGALAELRCQRSPLLDPSQVPSTALEPNLCLPPGRRRQGTRRPALRPQALLAAPAPLSHCSARSRGCIGHRGTRVHDGVRRVWGHCQSRHGHPPGSSIPSPSRGAAQPRGCRTPAVATPHSAPSPSPPQPPCPAHDEHEDGQQLGQALPQELVPDAEQGLSPLREGRGAHGAGQAGAVAAAPAPWGIL